ncbi:hypothetical protein ACFTXJ_08075 [Streptomyces zhihengii]|uniref:hypothetical protein n=1 Tax=Streptomyces zhihengii TaxID=1818004 RepID=UPI003624FF7E
MNPSDGLSSRLIRFYVTLPEPFAIPDGYSWYRKYEHDPNEGDDQQFVHLQFFQTEGTARSKGALDASLEVLRRVQGSVGKDVEELDEILQGQYTTVVATTLMDAAPIDAASFKSPQDVPVERDAVNRCVDEISRFLRTYKVALEALCSIPTYETLGPLIPFEVGDWVPLIAGDGSETDFRRPEWSDGGSIMLSHYNLADYPAGSEISESNEGRIEYFRQVLEQGNPLFLWKERFVEARTAIFKEGRYGAAVTLSNTATEVFLDALLALLYWESAKKPDEVAEYFAEGRLARRVKVRFSELLGGKWVLDGEGHVAEWFHNCYRLRHRVVHGGYSPTRLEAIEALDSAFSLSRYCSDRLAENRKKFPRSALIMLGEEGLQARQKWCQFMQDFSRDVAPREPDWRAGYVAWREEMYTILLSRD